MRDSRGSGNFMAAERKKPRERLGWQGFGEFQGEFDRSLRFCGLSPYRLSRHHSELNSRRYAYYYTQSFGVCNYFFLDVAFSILWPTWIGNATSIPSAPIA